MHCTFSHLQIHRLYASTPGDHMDTIGLLVQWHDCARRQVYQGIRATIPFVWPMQHGCVIHTLKNNLSWKGQATSVLKECERTSEQVSHSMKPFQISWMEQRDIVPALPHWLLLLQLAVEFQPDLSNSVISSNRPINFKLHHYQEICGVISVSQSPSTSPQPEVAS